VIFLKDSLQLLKILQSQFITCSKYLEIQTEKTNALVIGDINKLDDIVKAEQSFIMQMESFEGKKNNILEQLGFGNLTIRYIIANCVEEVLKEQYQYVLDKSVDVLSKIKKAASLNQRLLKQRLLVVNNILDNSSKSITIPALDEREYKNINPELNKEKVKRA